MTLKIKQKKLVTYGQKWQSSPVMNAREKLIFLLGKATLQILENHEEWTAETTDEIAETAIQLGLGKAGENGLFEIIE